MEVSTSPSGPQIKRLTLSLCLFLSLALSLARSLSLSLALSRSLSLSLALSLSLSSSIWDELILPLGLGVYPLGALLNHSCEPNCVLYYAPGTHTQVLLRFALWGLIFSTIFYPGPEQNSNVETPPSEPETRRTRALTLTLLPRASALLLGLGLVAEDFGFGGCEPYCVF